MSDLIKFISKKAGFDEDPLWRQFFVRCALLNLLLHVVAAFYSTGYFNCDEHYQVLEWVGHRLGAVSSDALTWDFKAQLRQLIQPFLYWLVLKPIAALGVTNAYHWAFIARLFTGLVTWFTVTCVGLTLRDVFPNIAIRRCALMSLFFAFYLVMLSVRTMSETMATAMLQMAFAVVVLNQNSSRSGELRPWALVALGLFSGFTCQFRYQAVFGVVALWAWWVVVSRPSLRAIALVLGAFFTTVLMGCAIDYWGYHNWNFVPYISFKVQIVDGMAARWGTSPWWYYPVMVMDEVPMPFGVLLTVGVAYTWIRRPKDVLSWLTLVFVVGHSLISRKDLRFLFPVAFAATLMFWLMIEDLARSRFFRGISPRFLGSYVWFKWCLFAVNGLFLVAALGPRQPALAVIKAAYEGFPGGARILWQTNNPYEACSLKIRLYARESFQMSEVKELDEIGAVVQASALPVLFYRKGQGFPEPNAFLSERCELLSRHGLTTLVPPSWATSKAFQLLSSGDRYHQLFVCKKL